MVTKQLQHLSIEVGETDEENSIMQEKSALSTTSSFVSIRCVVLVLLWFQISFSILLVDYSRNVRNETYSNTDVIILSETVKFFISAVVIIITGADRDHDTNEETAYSAINVMNDNDGTEVVTTMDATSPRNSPNCNSQNYVIILKTFYKLIRTSGKMFVIVVLYAVSNVVALTAVEYLGSGAYNTLTQLKILTTASFGKVFLNRVYSFTKWRALVLLVMGCILVALPRTHEDCDGINSVENSNSGPVHQNTKIRKEVVGLICVTIQITISGFNSVYLEWILKNNNCSIWGRNFQMAALSIFILLISNIMFKSSTSSFMDNWTFCATLIVLVSSAGGLLVAATLKYADSVIKCFASAMSILFTVMVAYMFLGGYLSAVRFIGSAVTIVSLFNYILDVNTIS